MAKSCANESCISLLADLQPRNWDWLLGATDGQSHGKGSWKGGRVSRQAKENKRDLSPAGVQEGWAESSRLKYHTGSAWSEVTGCSYHLVTKQA